MPPRLVDASHLVQLPCDILHHILHMAAFRDTATSLASAHRILFRAWQSSDHDKMRLIQAHAKVHRDIRKRTKMRKPSTGFVIVFDDDIDDVWRLSMEEHLARKNARDESEMHRAEESHVNERSINFGLKYTCFWDD